MLSDPRPVVICYYFHYLPGNWVWLQFLCAVKIWGDHPHRQWHSKIKYLQGTPLLNWRLSQNSIISWGKNVTTFALDISSTIPRISHSVMHKQSCLLLLLGPSVHHKSVHQSISPSQIRSKNSFYWKLFTHNGSFLHLWHLWQNIQN